MTSRGNESARQGKAGAQRYWENNVETHCNTEITAPTGVALAAAVPNHLADIIDVDFSSGARRAEPHRVTAAMFKANVPEELRRLPQWLGYSPDPTPGPTFGRPKCPVILTKRERRASTRRPDTWNTFQVAEAFREKYGADPGTVGVGFVFTAAAGLLYLDIDCALDAIGNLRDWCKDFVEPFVGKAYLERSPSGRGIHVIGKGTLPNGATGGKKNFPEARDGDRVPEVALFTAGKYSTISADLFSPRPDVLGDITAEAAHVWALAGIDASGIDAAAGDAPADDDLPKVDRRRIPHAVREELEKCTAADSDDRSAARFRLYAQAAQRLSAEETFALVLAHEDWYQGSGAAEKGRSETWRDIIRCHAKSDTARGEFQSVTESEADARDRVPVAWNPLDYTRMLPEIEAAMIGRGLLRIDQAYVRVIEDEMPYTTHADNDRRPEHERLPPPRQIACVPMRDVDMLFAVERSAMLYRETSKGPQAIPVPLGKPSLPVLLLRLPEKRAPRVAGLVQHPIITVDGRLIDRDGYDLTTGLYVALGGWRFPTVPERPTQDEAKRAAQRIRELVLHDVLLRDEKIDGAALLAAYLTGVARKVLPQAPAVLINATVQGTGKTTLARMLHAVLTGRDMAVQSMSPDRGEFQKQALATLLRQPAMVTFDNIRDGSTIDNDQLAQLVTSPTFEGRVLGMSQNVMVPTNTLFVFTGNSVSVSSDLVRRFVKVDLLAREARPEQRHFTHPDPIRRAQEIRAAVITAVLTIQRAWHVSGEKERGASLGLGAEVDQLVTWPLAYAGEEGIFAKRDELTEQSPEEQAKTSVLLALHACYGASGEFTAATVVRDVGVRSEDVAFLDEPKRALREAIEEGDRQRVFNAKGLGAFLSTLGDQPPREGLTLRKRALHGRTLYRVERAG